MVEAYCIIKMRVTGKYENEFFNFNIWREL